jgi:hypothetical protein
VRQLVFSLGIVSLLCACGGGDASPASIDGTWSATAQAGNASFTLRLSTQNDVVSGAGTYSTAAVRLGVLAVAGTYQPPAAILTFAFDNGDKAVYAATVSDASHMSGKLTYQNGTMLDLDFVRQ